MDSNKNHREFSKALHDFTFDVAGGAAIRHLANLGYTVPEIKKQLDYPMSETQIAQAMWKHLIDTGIIALEDPADNPPKERVTYVSCKGEYGRTYFKRVAKPNCIEADAVYIKCDFGRMKYKDREGFAKRVALLEQSDQDYISYLPWPLNAVWHKMDSRIERIAATMNMDVDC